MNIIVRLVGKYTRNRKSKKDLFEKWTNEANRIADELFTLVENRRDHDSGWLKVDRLRQFDTLGESTVISMVRRELAKIDPTLYLTAEEDPHQGLYLILLRASYARTIL